MKVPHTPNKTLSSCNQGKRTFNNPEDLPGRDKQNPVIRSPFRRCINRDNVPQIKVLSRRVPKNMSV